MRTRYLTNAILMTIGAFLVVTSQTFAATTFMWLMFGCAIGVLALTAAASSSPGRGAPQRSLDGIASLLGAWTIVAAVVFSGATVTWLGFAAGAGLFALALTGLSLHELRSERVVHSLEIPAQGVTGDLAHSH